MGELLRPLGELATLIVSAIALLVILFFPDGFLGMLRGTRALMSDAASRAPMLEVSKLTKRFGGLVAVKDLSFSIRPGEILGLIGPNGSGKSTAMKPIMGVERPSAGSIRLDGAEIAGLPAHKIARLGVGLVFQHSRPLQPADGAREHQGRAAARQAHAARRRRARRRAGARHRRARRPRGGARPPAADAAFADLRRLELAKAIARHPKLVMVDEPFAGLTASEVAAFSELIRGFRAEGRAVLLVDHNVKGVAALVDRVLAMYLGEWIAEGAAADVMRDETVRRVYLGGALDAARRGRRRASPTRRRRCRSTTSACSTARRSR